MSIIIPLSDYTNSIKRIDDHGSNCNIGDIITWFQDGTRGKKEEKGQQFGKITNINQKSLSVKNKTHKKILSYLRDKEVLRIYKIFENSLDLSL